MMLDTLGHEAAQRAHTAVSRIEVAEPGAVIDRRRRGRMTQTTVIGFAALLVVTAAAVAVIRDTATSSRSSHVQVRPSTTALPKGNLEFRAVEYVGDTPQIYPSGSPDCSTRPVQAATVLFDRTHQSCYDLGPALVTGASVRSVDVTYDPTQSQWAVNLHWRDDKFNTKVAGPLVNKDIAIVLNGVVESAPVINPGITGTSVEISGNFSKADAVNLAASIMGIAPSAIPVH